MKQKIISKLVEWAMMFINKYEPSWNIYQVLQKKQKGNIPLHHLLHAVLDSYPERPDFMYRLDTFMQAYNRASKQEKDMLVKGKTEETIFNIYPSRSDYLSMIINNYPRWKEDFLKRDFDATQKHGTLYNMLSVDKVRGCAEKSS